MLQAMSDTGQHGSQIESVHSNTNLLLSVQKEDAHQSTRQKPQHYFCGLAVCCWNRAEYMFIYIFTKQSTELCSMLIMCHPLGKSDAGESQSQMDSASLWQEGGRDMSSSLPLWQHFASKTSRSTCMKIFSQGSDA